MRPFNKDVTDKLNQHFYQLISFKAQSKKKEFQSPITNRVVKLQVDLPPRKTPDTYYLLNEDSLMSKKEKKKFSTSYAVEVAFLKILGAQNYKKVHERTTKCFVDFLKIQNLSGFLEDQFEDSDVRKLVQEAVLKFKCKDRKKIVKFMFVSKEADAVKTLNQICQLSALKKENYTYQILDRDPLVVKRVLEILDSYVLNTNSEYRLLQ